MASHCSSGVCWLLEGAFTQQRKCEASKKWLRVSVTSHEMFRTKPEMAEEDKPASLREEMYFDSALIGLHNSNIHVILFRFRSGLSDFKFPSDTPRLLLFGHHVNCLIRLSTDAHQHDWRQHQDCVPWHPSLSIASRAALDFTMKQKMFMFAQLSKW